MTILFLLGILALELAAGTAVGGFRWAFCHRQEAGAAVLAGLALAA